MKERFFRIAKEESYLSDYDGQHLGAVAVYADKFILAKAHNSDKTTTTQFFYNRYRVKQKSNIMEKPSKTHAELSLWRKIRYLDTDFSKIWIYVYRETKDGKMALAKPCPACEAALRDLGIKKVCYTTNQGCIEERYL